MKIETLTVRHFKSIGEATLQCARVNVIIGEANAGKSNLIEALALFCRPFVDFKGFGRVVRHGVPDDLFHLYDVTVPVEVRADGWSFRLKKGETRFEFEALQKEQRFFKGSLRAADDGGGFSEPDSPSLFRYYRYEVEPFTTPRKEVDFLWPPDGSNLPRLVRTNPGLRQAVQDLLKPFGIRLVLKPGLGDIELMEELPDGTPMLYPYANLSDTLRRAVFFLAALVTNHDAVILLEEPETHSFPLYVKYLAELMALDDKGNQFFVVTHNPYLLGSLVSKTPQEELAVFVASRQDRRTSLTRLAPEKLAEALDEGADVFFNLEALRT